MPSQHPDKRTIAPLETDEFCIRLATRDDRAAILDFIRTHWNASHAFVCFPQLFDYEHLVNDELRFVVGIDKAARQIVCIQGYILSSSCDKPDVWGAIWKVADTRIPAIGYRVHQYLKEAFAPGIYTGVGVNAITFGLHRKMGHTVGHLDHYYRLALRDEFRIALVTDRTHTPLSDATTRLHEFDDWPALASAFDPERFREQRPYKDAWYIQRRYFQHPVYRYRVFGMNDATGCTQGLLVAREVFHNGSSALRFVDLIGNAEPLAGASHAIQALIEDGGHEYVDFYCHGIDADIMRRAGFTRKDPEGQNVIPNYFEPFLQKNIALAYVTSQPDVRICKADADQDRPNSMPQSKTLMAGTCGS